MLKHKKTLCFVSVLFLLAGLQAQEKKLSLTLEECITKSMRDNLNVAVEVLSPELDDASISLAKERFLPSLTFGYNLQNTNSPSFSFIEADETVTSDYFDYSAIISQIIPTGGSFRLSLISYKTESNQKFLSVIPGLEALCDFFSPSRF